MDARRLRDKLRGYYADPRRVPSSSRCPKAATCRSSSSLRGRLPWPTSHLSPPKRTLPAKITELVPLRRRFPTPPARSRMVAWRRAALALGMVALLAGYAVFALRSRRRSPTGRIMLAVLPFQNLTGDPEQEYLCDGLTEEMIARPRRRLDPRAIGVIARTSAMHYKNTTKRADEIGRELGVRLSPRDEPPTNRRSRSNHGAARSMRDLRATSGWSSTSATRGTSSRCNARSPPPLHGARRRALALDAPRPELQRGSSGDQFPRLRALSSWALSIGLKGTLDGLHKALDHFQKAIALDPSYTRAYSGLADTYALLGSYASCRSASLTRWAGGRP